jgi:adenosine deaminase
MQDFIADIPKAELHLHIEGTLSPETILRLASRNEMNYPLKTAKDVEDALMNREAGLESFLDHHYRVVSVIQTREDFHDVTYELLRKCEENNIVYVEAFFDPQYHTARGIPFEDVMEGIDEGRRKGEEAFGVEANLIMCINRERTVESAFEMLDQSHPYRDRILGLGLDSYEEGNPPSKFEAVYAEARKQGYHLTAHCDVDQDDSVQHIWECLELLRVERIDHGINSIEDPKLVEDLKRRKICLTTCPTWRSPYLEPRDIDRIMEMYKRGLMVTLNTDDPAEFITGYITKTLTDFQESSGCTRVDLVRFMANAFEGSWAPRSFRDAYVKALLEYSCACSENHSYMDSSENTR